MTGGLSSHAFKSQSEATVHSLDHSPPVVLEADLQLLEDLAALLQLGSVSIWEGHVVHGEASLVVDVEQGGNSVLVQFSSGAENKHFLNALILELLCSREREQLILPTKLQSGQNFCF